MVPTICLTLALTLTLTLTLVNAWEWDGTKTFHTKFVCTSRILKRKAIPPILHLNMKDQRKWIRIKKEKNKT